MDAHIFWSIVKKEVEKQNTTFEWLYRKTKIPKGTFSSWKNRNIVPRADEAYRIADALGVSVEYLLTGMDTAEHLSNPGIQEIVERIIFFDDTDLESVKALVRTMSTRYLKSDITGMSSKVSG
ncbi:MAG: helix-turn-helix domain containing protein [Spirochaetaceae bacterium]|jgi:transcriptional regulator with XRE-family HTH domain|nr:helix-turn-helix domain containing protein [Spirochaetaceae bacterium]